MSGTNGDVFVGQTGRGPIRGTNGTRPWDRPRSSLKQTCHFLFNYTVTLPLCPVCPWDGFPLVPGTIVPQGASEKCLCVLCLLFLCQLILRNLEGGISPLNQGGGRQKAV